MEPGYNFNINKWSLYAKGGTYLLPIDELTGLYINALLETFDETMALFILDERANFRPAGIGRFARSKGGHLEDNLFRTVMGYQATHVDEDFYDRFYRPEALSETQRSHQARWHDRE